MVCRLLSYCFIHGQLALWLINFTRKLTRSPYEKSHACTVLASMSVLIFFSFASNVGIYLFIPEVEADRGMAWERFIF